MSDPTLTALRALAEDVGERAVPPPFDEVTARAGRRRRTRASLVAAAAVLVLGVAGAALVARRARPFAFPRASRVDGVAARGSLGARRARECRAVRDGRRARRLARGDLARPRAPGADVRAGRPGLRRQRQRAAARRAARPDGGSRRLGRVARRAAGVLRAPRRHRRGPARRVNAGAPRSRRLGRPALGPIAVVAVAHRPARAPGAGQGHDAVPGHGPGPGRHLRSRLDLLETTKGSEVVLPEGTRAVVLAAYGGDIAAAALGDAPDGSIPTLELVVSHDLGDTWQRATGIRSAGTTSMVVTPAGTTLTTDDHGGYTRVDKSGHGVVTETPSLSASPSRATGSRHSSTTTAPVSCGPTTTAAPGNRAPCPAAERWRGGTELRAARQASPATRIRRRMRGCAESERGGTRLAVGPTFQAGPTRGPTRACLPPTSCTARAWPGSASCCEGSTCRRVGCSLIWAVPTGSSSRSSDVVGSCRRHGVRPATTLIVVCSGPPAVATWPMSASGGSTSTTPALTWSSPGTW